MKTRKTLVKARAGVRLERIEGLCAQGRVLQQIYRLSTRRSIRPRVLADALDADEAFDLEVLATLSDPVFSRMIE